MTTASTSIRLDPALRERAHAEAARRGETFADAVRHFAEDYAVGRDVSILARIALAVIADAMTDPSDPIHSWSGEGVRSFLTGVLSAVPTNELPTRNRPTNGDTA